MTKPTPFVHPPQVPSGVSTTRLQGILENFVGTDAEAAHTVLGPGQVRIAVRAAGMNFRDVLNALGIVPAPWLGLELRRHRARGR